MAPTDFDYIATRNQIIQSALETVGALRPGQAPSGAMLQQAVGVLQRLVKSWSNKHLFLWSFNIDDFPTVASQEAYDASLDQAIIGLDKAWIVESGNDEPIEVISWSRYQDIRDKETNTGRPRAICYKPTPAPSFYVWPSPDAIYTIKALTVFALKDFDTADGTGDIPARFQLALEYGLADLLFDKYPAPMNERTLIGNKAAVFFSEAQNADMPVETTSEVEGMY